jgi:uncharacterized damage-inducible protein DinB
MRIERVESNASDAWLPCGACTGNVHRSIVAPDWRRVPANNEVTMITPAHVRLMAAYNLWQNGSVFSTAETLNEADRHADQGAFFGSIEATLNHLLWGDRIWMHRFAGFPAPSVPDIASSTGETASWDELHAARGALDRRIVDWADGLRAGDLEGDLTWFSGAAGREITKPLWLLITHFFNHQTHHRGQVHAMLTATGARPGDTDIPLMPQSA